MDVVYNHTSAAGTDPKSVLDQIVPGYYHRLLDDGTVANSTCCANTAPEHAMMGKLVVDSLVTWAKEYKVDGFRFDLMGHHPKANILAVRAALDQLTLARDGVDGKKIMLYGEGWNFGEVADDARFVQATQANMAGTGIGTFNDRLRDAVRGGGPFDANPRVQGFASGLFTDPNGDPVNGSAAEQRARLLHYHDLIKVGLTGNLRGYRFTDSAGRTVTGAQVDYNGSPAGYTAAPGEAVTYVDAHDNEILYDALAYKLPRAPRPRTGPGCRCSRWPRRCWARAPASSPPAPSGCGRSRWTATRSTPATGSTRSAGTARRATGSAPGCRRPRTTGQVAVREAAAGRPGAGAGLRGDRPDRRPVRRAAADPGLLAGVRAGHRQEVQQRVAFPLSGRDETPGVLTMTLDARGLDGQWKSVTVVFNATPEAAKQTVTGLRGADVALHPVLRTSADPVLRTASFDRATGTFTVPARSVAVFVQQ